MSVEWKSRYGEVVWVKNANDPWWPSYVYDPEKLPAACMEVVKTKSLEQIGEKYVIYFYADANYQWATESDMKPFNDETKAEFEEQSVSKKYREMFDKCIEIAGDERKRESPNKSNRGEESGKRKKAGDLEREKDGGKKEEAAEEVKGDESGYELTRGVVAMKGLPSTCCQCGVKLSSHIEGRRPLELFCNCLVSLCKVCGNNQLVQHFSTSGPSGSYIECPVCRSRDSNHKNGYVVGNEAALVVLTELLASTRKRFPAKAERRSCVMGIRGGIKGQQHFKLAQNHGGFGIARLPTGIPHLQLYIARCEQHLQKFDQRPENYASLDLGPLSKVKLKENFVLERVLGLVEEQEQKGKQGQETGGGDILQRLQEELPSVCQNCDEELRPGNTVRGGECSCCIQYCQLCTRRLVTSLKEGTCCYCRKLIPVLEIKGARACQEEFVRSLIAEKTGFKPGIGRPKKYQLCWDLKDQTNLPSDFNIHQDAIEDSSVFLALDEGVLNLGLARVQADLTRRRELQRRAEEQGIPTVASLSDYLPVGPIGQLAIRRDVFLECVLGALGRKAYGREQQQGQEQGQSSSPSNSGVASVAQVYICDPEAEVDETKPVMAVPDLPEGELEGGREVCFQTDPLTNLLRSQPHPGCSVDPRCPHYLATHMHHFHGEEAQAAQGEKAQAPASAAALACNEPISPSPNWRLRGGGG
ncbi:PWWP domain-containing protein [Ochromonadaceae sp. CCMP2298]|nr:PWWP domain-containing protein [Ochromonadaceae sp. CCMP2298]